MTTALAPSSALSAADRCDRCGAQAYVRVTLTSGGELLFCAHHGREHSEKLRDIAITIHDETGRLEATTPTIAVDDER
jgi:ribosomal protein L37E